MSTARPSLRTVLALAVALPLAGGLGTVGLGLGTGSRQVVERVSEATHREVGLRIRAELRPLLDAPHALNAANAELLATVGPLDDAAMERHLWRQLRQADGVGYVQVGYEVDGGFVGVERADGGAWRSEVSDAGRTGKAVWQLDDTGERIEPPLSFVDGYDARTRPWYGAAVDADGPTWSSIYPFSSKAAPRLGITAVRPLRDTEGHRIGVLGADLILGQLSDLLDPGELGPDARIALVERDGMLVASSAGAPFHVRDGKPERVRADEAGDDVLGAVVRSLAGDGGLGGITGDRTFRLQEPDTLVFAAPLADERGLDWVLLVAVPAEATVGPLRDQVRTALLLGLGLMAVAAGGGVALAGLLTRPLRQISLASEALARGQWNHPLPKRTTTHEVETLTRAFELMRAQVQSTLADAEQARRAAEDGNRAKTTFLAGVSHELRTPLNAILGYAELLLEDDGLAEEPRGDVERIRSAAGDLLSLINDLLDLARLESGRISLVLEDLDPSALCREVAEGLGPVVAARGNRLVLELGSCPPVRADRQRLRQVLVNLLGNAAKFTSDGLITVRTRAGGEDVWIEVEDTGAGMAPELVPLIFRPFERLPGSERREGTGLGLAIVARLLDALGGRVEVDSALGRGSRFTVRLPAAGPMPGYSGAHDRTDRQR
ncbi:MAG: sensor histidine kinase [Alphaproteobacteria bacterium]|nr:sensor histidine kinase [Alphaproteobacteria bacterium]MCB9699687.1 sensor histidine kinase [Alphaproteobacteria bacterium]